MTNLSYNRSSRRENQIKHLFEKDGWYAVRAAGSHGVADVVAIRPSRDKCGDPYHFEVRLIQVKTSRKIKKGGIEVKAQHMPGLFMANVEYWNYPSRKPKKKVKTFEEEGI
jgi:Holliday junction resolvase